MSDLPNDPAEQQDGFPEQPDQIGHYKILDPLGEGGLGVVYLATSVSLRGFGIV